MQAAHRVGVLRLDSTFELVLALLRAAPHIRRCRNPIVQNERTHRDHAAREQLHGRYQALAAGHEKEQLKKEIVDLDRGIKVFIE